MTDRLTAAQIAEIEARHTAATGGEWFYDPDEPSETVSTTHGTIVCRVLTAADFPCVEEGTEDDVNRESAATAAFIAAAHQDIPALLRDLRAAREALKNVVKATAGGQDRHSAAAHSIARAALHLAPAVDAMSLALAATPERKLEHTSDMELLRLAEMLHGSEFTTMMGEVRAEMERRRMSAPEAGGGNG